MATLWRRFASRSSRVGAGRPLECRERRAVRATASGERAANLCAEFGGARVTWRAPGGAPGRAGARAECACARAACCWQRAQWPAGSELVSGQLGERAASLFWRRVAHTSAEFQHRRRALQRKHRRDANTDANTNTNANTNTDSQIRRFAGEQKRKQQANQVSTLAPARAAREARSKQRAASGERPNSSHKCKLAASHAAGCVNATALGDT